MHTIEPYYSWLNYYSANDDEHSPFYGKIYNEFEYTNTIYNYFIHPQWDEIGSETLYIKVLFANYELGYCIIEMIGEWNDAVNNDIMYLKRNVIEVFQTSGINKFILIGENVLNFHASDDSYYQEWFDEIEDGWIAGINFRDHVIREFGNFNLDYYIAFGVTLNNLNWRKYTPFQFFEKVDELIAKRLTA